MATILLADDDSSIRRLVRMMLEPQGYTVLEAKDPDEALRIGQETTSSIDLLLLDVVLPKMNGRALAKRLRGLHPRAKVLFMSGFPDFAIGPKGVLAPEASYLAKPFAEETLIDAVGSILRRE